MSRTTSDGRSDRSTRDADDDIGALFDAQADHATVPPALDAIVRAAARDARGDVSTADVAAPFPVTARHRAPPRWLAVAAVAVLALVLVPLLRQAPPPDAPSPNAPVPAASSSGTPEERRTFADTAVRVAPADPGARAAPDGETLFEAAPITRSERFSPPPAVAVEERTDTEEGADAASRNRAVEPEPLAESSPTNAAVSEPTRNPAPADAEANREAAADAPSSGRVSSLAGGERAAGKRLDDPFDGYRSTPRAWLERLRERLRVDGLTTELLAEYRRFRSHHPDVSPGFDPAAVGRDGKAGER